ncbi:epoxide hydrolase [Sorangium cellulosum]|uniref:Epoxide hydrolase n=1 Tax=Sorangium cellulosum TaxID=56 RepID=A0A4P2QCU0_SORCE|nr:nuclear transport factor 2 family protein [Sorangium cellulosum]AUX27221.1 epoxide hydrolase [Sorangium cellulosum]
MSKASDFIDALRRIETDGNVEPMAALFGPDAELSNPAITRPLHGQDGARNFWRSYRHTFGEVRSEFRCVVESECASFLEWTSRGTLSHGAAFSYDGVSVIEHPAGAITRFKSYFDPKALGLQLEHAA